MRITTLNAYNPVALLMEKPGRSEHEARWLEAPDAALLLAAAARLPAVETSAGLSSGAELAYPLVATFLLTGGRSAEVLGLELDDVSFDRSVITIRPNAWRRLKTRTSHHVVPLWPQLSPKSYGLTCSGHASSAGASCCSPPSWTAASNC